MDNTRTTPARVLKYATLSLAAGRPPTRTGLARPRRWWQARQRPRGFTLGPLGGFHSYLDWSLSVLCGKLDMLYPEDFLRSKTLTVRTTQLSFFGDDKVVDSREQKKLPETYKGLYAMHKYWSKKPYNLIADYIKQFSSPGDIIVDSFCGSGVTIIESVRLRRRAVGIDINPTATLVTRMGLSHVDIYALQRNFNALKEEMKPIINSLYQTECAKCKSSEAVITHTIWQEDQPQEVWYECSQCGTRKAVKAASDGDLQAAYNPVKPQVGTPLRS